MGEGCDCTELCSMGPTCPGGMLAGLDGAGCWRTPAVPDPTVEALSEAERRMLDEPIYNPNLDMHQRSDLVAEVAERILTARAAAPDALRVAVEALLDGIDKDREFWLAEAERRHDTFTFVQRDVADYRATRDPQVVRLRALLEDGAQ